MGKFKFEFNSILFFALFISVIGFQSCKPKTVEKSQDELGFNNLDSLTLQLEQIRILFPSIAQWEEKGAITYAKDSAIINDFTAEMLLEKTFTINVDAAIQLLVEEQYETHLGIVSNGETTLDLSGLGNYTSPWRVITPDKNGRYLKAAYSAEERTRYSNVTLDQINAYIFNMTSKNPATDFDWLKYVSQAKTVSDFPFDVDVSKITVRFTGKYIGGGQPFVKYIVFNLRRI